MYELHKLMSIVVEKPTKLHICQKMQAKLLGTELYSHGNTYIVDSKAMTVWKKKIVANCWIYLLSYPKDMSAVFGVSLPTRCLFSIFFK